MHRYRWEFYQISERFLSDKYHYQRVVLNGQASFWAYFKVPDLNEVSITRNNLTQENNPVSIFVCNILFLSEYHES